MFVRVCVSSDDRMVELDAKIERLMKLDDVAKPDSVWEP